MAADDQRGEADEGLQPVARRTSPPLWIGGWALGLGVVIAVGLIGTLTYVPPPPLGDSDVFVQSPSPVTPTPSPTPPGHGATSHVAAAPAPYPTRPPLGEDGLVGGLVFGTNWPPQP
jgi:hypothetical protein